MSTPGNNFPPPMPPEELAAFVSGYFVKLGPQIAPQVRQLGLYFKQLKPGLTISGCKTWDEFCRKVLHRTRRAINYFLAGGNPNNKKRQRDKFNWRDEWDGMPEFNNTDQRPHQSVIVHFKTAADVQHFARLVGQKLTAKSRFLWYPRPEKTFTKAMFWVDRAEALDREEVA